MNTPTKEQIEAALSHSDSEETTGGIRTRMSLRDLAAAYREQQREIEGGRERWRLSSVCRELKQQRDALAYALELLLSISCEILKNDEKTLSSIATITDKKSGKQYSVSVIDAIEAAGAALATLKGGSDE